jgi:hypothetical protein
LREPQQEVDERRLIRRRSASEAGDEPSGFAEANEFLCLVIRQRREGASQVGS